ncbi:uncharacterized protein UV8b_04295 [Ustilaginoidea virens]|uniref:Uncharacterized protein n=1 Tax=Ustilaginoidea virens TaxID=1159556 RepID=A0A063C9N0_USTVR|nr:uncharacterized protein UV8b_04295 [Ustilaginoidea virens]QUC20054.1 hypothetical protein UV8b_04295 [Ustilaginoidea virens]GAO14500.1 hypothetical protein UVI_02032120 [Ustilaginoidea virens]
MPSRLNGPATPRFELPALDLNFGSITDGTNIPPPPLDSPIVPTPPQTPPQTKRVDEAVINGDAVEKTSSPDCNTAGNKWPADEAPSSPAGSARQGSLRRLLSRNMLNASYLEGNSTSLDNVTRPPSRSAHSLTAGYKSRRNSWFNLFKSGESKRSSIMFDDSSTMPKRRAGPPPPTIPELKGIETKDGSLGNDLFKNIK